MRKVSKILLSALLMFSMFFTMNVVNAEETTTEDTEKATTGETLFEQFNKWIGENYPNVSSWIGDETEMQYVLITSDAEDEIEREYIIIGTIYFNEGKTFEELCDEMRSLIGNLKNEITEEVSINNDVLTSIKNNGVVATYEQKKDDIILYSWIFDGSKITSTDFDIDLNVNIGTSTNKEAIELLVTDKENALVLEFAYHGNLPTGTKVKINVSDKYTNGDKVTLYYYNEFGKLEEVATDLVVENGFVEFGLEHCSEYVLTKQEERVEQEETVEVPVTGPVNNEINTAPNNAQTSSLNLVLYSILAVGSLSGIVYIVVKNRKKGA